MSGMDLAKTRLNSAMSRFVAKQNVEHFQRLLKTGRDPAQREVVTRLLAQTVAQLNALEWGAAA